jgi:hypothetical protein
LGDVVKLLYSIYGFIEGGRKMRTLSDWHYRSGPPEPREVDIDTIMDERYHQKKDDEATEEGER